MRDGLFVRTCPSVTRQACQDGQHNTNTKQPHLHRHTLSIYPSIHTHDSALAHSISPAQYHAASYPLSHQSWKTDPPNVSHPSLRGCFESVTAVPLSIPEGHVCRQQTTFGGLASNDESQTERGDLVVQRRMTLSWLECVCVCVWSVVICVCVSWGCACVCVSC